MAGVTARQVWTVAGWAQASAAAQARHRGLQIAGVVERYNPNQPRDNDGRWTDGPGVDLNDFAPATLDDLPGLDDPAPAVSLYSRDEIALPLNRWLRADEDDPSVSDVAHGASVTDEDWETYGSTRDYDLEEVMDGIDAALERLPRSVTLWRAAALTPDQLDQMAPGTEFSDAAFMSTSISREAAEEYGGIRASQHPGTTPVMFRMLVPKGTMAVGVPEDGVDTIGEMLLDRDLPQTVVSRDGNVITVKVGR